MTVKELKMYLNEPDVTDDMWVVCTQPVYGAEIYPHYACIKKEDMYGDGTEYEKVFGLNIEARY